MKRSAWAFLRTAIGRARRHKSLPMQVIDVVTHKVRLNTSPIDYYRFEFYDGTRSWEEKSRYVGKRGSRFYPYQENPVMHAAMFGNKILFAALLKGLDLPHNPTITTVGPGQAIPDEASFAEFARTYRGDLVLKPSRGSGGKGVLFLTFSDDGLRLNQKPIDVGACWQALKQYGFRSGYIAEAVVRNSPALQRYHPASLNTYRIVTIRTRDGRWHVAATVLRVGRSGHRVDNISSGGICVFVDADGVSAGGYDWLRWERIAAHPDTGVPLVGERLEGLRDAETLALRASAAIQVLGSIGWDIAVTPAGPVIMEANAFYDCSYWQVRPGRPLITPEIASGLPQWGLLPRWDRRRMRPGFSIGQIRA